MLIRMSLEYRLVRVEATLYNMTKKFSLGILCGEYGQIVFSFPKLDKICQFCESIILLKIVLQVFLSIISHFIKYYIVPMLIKGVDAL